MQEPRYYQLYSSGTDQKDVAEILEWFSLREGDSQANDILLLNYFNEIPICFAATIDSVDRGVVEMTTHKTQLIAMLDQKITFLKSDSLQHSVFAKVQRVDLGKNKVFISNFSYVLIRSMRREHLRVKPKNILDVGFECDEFSVRGFLYDISIGGLSILTTDQADAEIGVQGTVGLYLAGTKQKVPCRLLKVLDTDNSKKYVFIFDLNPKIEMLISQFICQIQNETIRELKDRIESLEIMQ